MINSFHPPFPLKQMPALPFLLAVVMWPVRRCILEEVYSGTAFAMNEETKGLLRPVI
ncbi:hypothetical protein B4099_3603 [Heyndrickxia coagulans]|uniref:Uncharacterized protein n=1 Tax=Heyndrickxia coagulans TaxID=1398 RepID=A0A150JVQ5_HEYCO|nr:hypothetical protein B4099_3603 [Heyndrickxia coagulans]